MGYCSSNTVAWDEWQNEMVTVEDFIRNYNVTFKTYRKDKNKVKLFHTNKGNTVYIGFMHIDDGPYTLSHVNVTEIKQRKQNSNNK